jgi:hypothetical protein
MASTRVRRTVGILVVVGGLVGVAAALGAQRAPARTPPPPKAFNAPETQHLLPPPAPPPVPAAPAPVTSAECPGAPAQAAVTTGNPEARKAAQRGLGFLQREAVAWQQVNPCYGCHVQAVTIEALSVGAAHQYDIRASSFNAILNGMLNLDGGAHGPNGLFHFNAEIGQSAKVLGAAALARYDQHVGPKVRKELLAEARRIRARQQKNGAVTLPFTSPPVIIGTVQGTAEAIITWKRAYDRTADDQWLTAIQRAEAYLSSTVERWGTRAPDLQSLDYAIMGLLAAGVGAQEQQLVGLANQVRSRQRGDGGWALARGEESSPFATGQALYTLRLTGMSDHDAAIEKGTRWLIKHQARSGGWSEAGFGKAEAMWAVLGLVSIDVLSIDVAGLDDGQRIDGVPVLSVSAKDNGGVGVVKLEIDVDDQLVASACGATLKWPFSPALGATGGRRVLEVKAWNARGEVSRRRLEVYTGDTYMTQLGSRFEGGGTELSLRDLTAVGSTHTVALEIFPAGSSDRATPVWTTQQAGAQGAVHFRWDGKSADGKAQKAGKYVARLSYRDASGKLRQQEELGFVHDTSERQLAEYGQIGGRLSMPGGGAASNAEVELVDSQSGAVVGTTRSTQAGQYRFRNVDADKKYEVRVRKDGYVAAPAAAAPAKAAEVEADIQVMAK